MPAGGVKVELAFADPVLEPDPTWTDLTDSPNRVASVTIDRGRLYEFDITDTGTATVAINDRDGTYDPNNLDSPYVGQIQPLLQAQISLRDPVADTYTVIFRGFIEDWDYGFDPSQKVNRLTLRLVDGFAILQAIQMNPGQFGDEPPADASVIGNIFFAPAASVDDRMFQVLVDNAGWAHELTKIFSGNVSLQYAVYSPGETVLQVLQDCADAEFPGVANVYMSKLGYVTFHGRFAKFDPIAVSTDPDNDWDFRIWKAGDGAAVAASIADTAQIRALATNRGRSKIINDALATPQDITDAAIAAQRVQDLTSIGKYGFCSWTRENLKTNGSKTGDNVKKPNAETKLFAEYYVANYAEPQNRITGITFRSMDPDDERAAPNWALMAGSEISDQVNVIVTAPGGVPGAGSGFNGEGFFIEGLHYQIDPLVPDYANVTLTLDLSPVQYFDDASMFGDS